MGLSKKKHKKSPVLGSEEVINKITQIKDLHNQGNLSALKACVLMTELVIDCKLEKDKRVAALYKDLGISPSEGQKQAKIGREFGHLIKSGHVAAFSISHFKKMLTMEEKFIDIIFNDELRLTVAELAIISQSPELFKNCDDGEQLCKILSANKKNNFGEKAKVKKQGKDENDEQGDSGDSHNNEVDDAADDEKESEEDDGEETGLPPGDSPIEPKITLLKTLKKVVEDLKSASKKAKKIKIDENKSEKIKEIIRLIRSEVKRIEEEL